jgi:hypothetical protein
MVSHTSDSVAVTSPALLPQSSLPLCPPAVVLPPNPAPASQPPTTPPVATSAPTTSALRNQFPRHRANSLRRCYLPNDAPQPRQLVSQHLRVIE